MAVKRDAKGRFLTGSVGNPGGRPRIPEELKTKLCNGAAKSVDFWLQLIADDEAKTEHRLKAAEYLFSYAYGKATQIVDASLEAEVSQVRLSLSDKLKLVQQAAEAVKEAAAE